MPNPIDIYDDKGKKIGEARERDWGYKGDDSNYNRPSSSGSGGGGVSKDEDVAAELLIGALCIIAVIAVIVGIIILPLRAFFLWLTGGV